MDSRQCLIIDLKNKDNGQMFITEQIASIKHDARGYWEVCFSTSPRVFHYHPERLVYLNRPETIDLGGRGLYVRNVRFSDVQELLRFSDDRYTYYRLTDTKGRVKFIEGKQVYITRTPIDETGGSLWSYLKKLAVETGIEVEAGKNILSMQYEQLDVCRDNVPLAQYLGDATKLRVYRQPSQIYYPFGCNASQKRAVERALTHQVSIIQGPPGTGKTQTILNIISNLLIAGKTVLIVSNNNSAVENVAEKLQREGLGFLVAQLGSVKNKEAFIAQQEEDYPDMSSWLLEDAKPVQWRAREALQRVERGFGHQTAKARLLSELDTLLREKKYNELLQRPSGQDTGWLIHQHADKIMKLLYQCRSRLEQGKQLSFWFRLRWSFTLGWRALKFLQGELSDIITALEQAYYQAAEAMLEAELHRETKALEEMNLAEQVRTLTSSSLQILKHVMAQRFSGQARQIFKIKELKTRSKAFLSEYPVVLSTTYSARNCISPDRVFDYVIMDEASQVDIKTGALALSCATNAVIVGDDKQLPNVVTREDLLVLQSIEDSYQVADCYRASTHSFLQSCAGVFRDAPSTLLREHYRCHPEIIGFCNEQFYDGELVTMTTDTGASRALQVIRTVKGNHARGLLNQREIDVIAQEVMPELLAEEDMGSVGIITPYKEQAKEINKVLGKEIASTVHKYQGRECDTIIMSTVNNTPTTFSDDPNLLNVAISRAKKHLYLVTTGNDIPQESNLAQLIAYIRYHNFEVKESLLHSVFDLLYRQYTAERLAYQAKHHQSMGHLSEQLVYDALLEALDQLGGCHRSVVAHYPLSKLIAGWDLLTDQERAFASSPLAHVDFLVYNALTRQPLLTIEVDGWRYHRGQADQKARDALKDQLLGKYGLTPYRITTTEIVTVDTLKVALEQRGVI